jgi:ABC-type nitrate/sulfonate/bicarbonate transport system ATPase subunit
MISAGARYRCNVERITTCSCHAIAYRGRSKFQGFNSTVATRRACHIHDETFVATTGPAGCGTTTLMSTQARIRRLEKVGMPAITPTGCMQT